MTLVVDNRSYDAQLKSSCRDPNTFKSLHMNHLLGGCWHLFIYVFVMNEMMINPSVIRMHAVS